MSIYVKAYEIEKSKDNYSSSFKNVETLLSYFCPMFMMKSTRKKYSIDIYFLRKMYKSYMCFKVNFSPSGKKITLVKILAH